MKKKILSLLLVTALTAAAFTGCGGKKDTTEATESTEIVENDADATYDSIAAEGIEDGCTLTAEANTTAVSKITEFAELINGHASAIDTIDITLTDASGAFTEPDGEVSVTISRDDLASGKGDSYVVYYLNIADGSAEPMETTWTDSDVTFKTTHFSTYAVIQYDSSKEDSTYFTAISGDGSSPLKKNDVENSSLNEKLDKYAKEKYGDNYSLTFGDSVSTLGDTVIGFGLHYCGASDWENCSESNPPKFPAPESGFDYQADYDYAKKILQEYYGNYPINVIEVYTSDISDVVYVTDEDNNITYNPINLVP